MRATRLALLLVALFAACSAPPQTTQQTALQENPARFEVLVFSKTAGFRHGSIEDGIAALHQLGEEHDFGVVATEDAAVFHPDTLRHYAAVVFLSTTGDILDEAQQAAFEGYIRQGGGFAGIHAAADTEYDWVWYGGLVGAYFESHPDRQNADVLFTDRRHPSTAGLPHRWNHYDEWYNYKANPRANVHVLAVVDERSYEGGAMGHDHPIAWAHRYDGGRAWYTGLGHTSESFSEDAFLRHLLGGIEWAAGAQDGDVTATLASGFEEVVLTGELTDPMEIDITTDGRVFIIEWAGAIKIWEPERHAMRVVGWLPVEKNIEDGLLGLALDPAFEDNGWLYIYYSPVTTGQKFNRLSRFTYDGAMIDMDSEIAVLEIPVQRVQCCHSGGAVQFDAHGLLYLSTGDNSGGDRDHADETRRRMADQGRTSGNTNDLRGKILRIRPQPDGTYTIPEGNLFEADALPRGEIFTMGHRNPFRFSIDNKTGWIYWGDVGPGAGGGWDEFNQARGPGFFGWPLFTGYNEPFKDYYFYGADDMTPYQDPARPINASPFNTGAHALPPAQPAWIPYLYGTSEEFPELGAGGLNPMAGPIFHFDAATAHPRAFPAYYDDKVMIYEWMRNWVQVVTLDEQGHLLKIDPFLPGLDYSSPMDIEVGPQGRLYLLEWGDEFWGSNANAQLVRLDYYGTEAYPSIAPETASSTHGPIRLAWPPDGGVFDFESPIRYRIDLMDQVLADQVSVRTYTGFDTSPFPLDSFTGLEGTFAISRKYTHSPDVHYVNRFAEVEACLGRSSEAADCARVRLQPKTKEAEHVSAKQDATRKTYSARPASEHWGRTALTVMRVQNGSQLAYEPINLINVESLTFRFRATEPGTLEARLDQPDAPVLAMLEMAPETGEAVVPAQAVYLEGVPPDASGLAQLEQGAYDNWREITVPITDPGGVHTLLLDFRSVASKTWLELDWIRFNGRGVLE